MYIPPPSNSKIIIVGAGCFGLSTAYALSLDKEKNYDIWVYDKATVPVPEAASTDISKAVRIDYGAKELYTRLGLEAITAWEEWNKEREQAKLVPVYHNSGFILFSSNNQFTQYEKDCMETIKRIGYGSFLEELHADQIKERYPFFSMTVDNGYNIAYINKIGGWCNSSEAIKHLYAKCVNNNVHFVLGQTTGCFQQLVTNPNNPRSVTGIVTQDGKTHHADRVIMATGPWTSSLIDMHQLVIATGQIVVHLKLTEEEQEHLKHLPTWSGDVSRTGFYGFPVNSDGILKIGKHSIGYLNPRSDQDSTSVPRTQSSNPGDTIPLAALKDFRQFLNEFFPFSTEHDIVYSRVCWYSDSIDGDFVISAHPDYDDLIVAAGDSGHAMKFLPVIGSKIRDVVEAKETEYTLAWSWRNTKAQEGFYDRPLLVKENSKEIRMATLNELKKQ
ncbi:L-pipecolate oxidase [Choanephora cucurbitarum]|uniref:L-pipecolate oxidase n=1 Tax=Choanephora cucurbitarum TaxID=101091 RepID=A0A1C7NRB6_9FUNG|nr:L-pipecolate oxidase [Choanephora cucurbitarum]